MKTKVFSPVLLAAMIGAIFITSPLAFATDAPQWMGTFVNDYAGILNNKAQLETMLSELDQNTTVEFAVVTITNLPSDEDMNGYAYKIFNTWGIGKKGQDNGLLLLMIENGTPGSRMKIEVGYGLEGYITDADAGRMLDDALPSYQNGDYSQAAYIVVNDAKKALEGVYVPGTTPPKSSPSIWIILSIVFAVAIIFIFIIVAILASRTKCPRCGSTKVKCVSDKASSASKDFTTETLTCTCQNCGLKFRKKKKKARIYPAIYAGGFGGGGWGGGGFGGGGFGGGGSGGGGAGR